MSGPAHKLSITWQAELVNISRASVYTLPALPSAHDLALTPE